MPSSRKRRRVVPADTLNLRDLPNYIPPPVVEESRPTSSSTASSSSSSRNHSEESNDFIDMLLQEAHETHEYIGISLKKMLKKFPAWKTLTNTRMSLKWRLYTAAKQLMCTIIGIITVVYQAYNTFADPTAYGYKTISTGNLSFGYALFTPGSTFKASFINEAYRILNISQELHNNNQAATDDKDWNIDEALGLTYLVHQICGTRKTSQFVPQRNVTDFNLDDSEIIWERDSSLMIDTLNRTELTDTIIPFIKRGMIACQDLIPYCSFAKDNCENDLHETLTDSGLGCAFNLKPIMAVEREPLLKSLFDSNTDEERVDKWKNVDSDTISFLNPNDDGNFIKTQQTPGKIGGLSVVIFDYKQERACPQIEGEGFMLTIGNPVDIPVVGRDGIALSYGFEHFVTVTPSAKYSDEALRQLFKDSRDCYFANEMTLQFFTTYSHSACIAECLAIFVEKNCFCKQLEYPGKPGTPLCDPIYGKYCVDRLERFFYSNGTLSICPHCKPNCNELTYTTQLSSIPLTRERIQELLEGQKIKSSMKATSASVIHIYVRDNSINALNVKLRLFISEIYGIVAGMLGASNELTLPKVFDILVWIHVVVGLLLYRGAIFVWGYRMNIRIWVQSISERLQRSTTFVEAFDEEAF